MTGIAALIAQRNADDLFCILILPEGAHITYKKAPIKRTNKKGASRDAYLHLIL